MDQQCTSVVVLHGLNITFLRASYLLPFYFFCYFSKLKHYHSSRLITIIIRQLNKELGKFSKFSKKLSIKNRRLKQLSKKISVNGQKKLQNFLYSSFSQTYIELGGGGARGGPPTFDQNQKNHKNQAKGFENDIKKFNKTEADGI